MTTDPLTVVRIIIEQGDTPADTLTAWATAALAEEQRTANLLALAETIETHYGGMLMLGYKQRITSNSVVAQVARRIGFAPADQDDEDTES